MSAGAFADGAPSGTGNGAGGTVVRALEPAAQPAAERWARRLGLPLSRPAAGAGGGPPSARAGGAPAGPTTLVLEVAVSGLALRLVGGPRVAVAPGAVLARPPGGRDLLLRAVGPLAPGSRVADATAGLGADALRLAASGARVTMIERVPLVAALLEDALERARAGREGHAAREAAERLTLLEGDARTLLAGLDPPPAVVVIDPMYPASGKRARPKKGMALFRRLVGADADAPAVLDAALAVATARVVVKRPRRAPYLGRDRGAPAPSGSVTGTTSRYDIYAPRRADS